MANTEVNHAGPRNGNGAEGNAPVATLVATVRTLLTEAPEAARLAGEKLQRVLAGRVEQANVTVPLNPCCGVMPMLTAPACPCFTVSAEGEAATVRSGVPPGGGSVPFTV